MAALSATIAKSSTLPAMTATVTTTTPGSADPATNEVQTITLDGGAIATGGTFTITYAGQTTSAIAYDATAATIDTALEALSNIEAGDMTVAGTLNGGLTLTFGGTLAATNVAAVTTSLASTTGTTSDVITFTLPAEIGGPLALHVVNRDADDVLAFKFGGSSPAQFGALADNAYVVAAGKDLAIPIGGMQGSLVVRVVGVPTVVYTAQLIPIS